ncbi:MAG TPA: toll/interleukin-1 receptor domain-containing protein [Thermoanaerobaculia bacterium]|nr:toll/interleukin-1 receptor domain-containing protein [Thermoanaerobaculia bacterium]
MTKNQKSPLALLGLIVPVLATVSSLASGIWILVDRLHLSLPLALSFGSVGLTFIFGMLSSMIARGVRIAFSGKRQVFLSYDESGATEAKSIARLLSDAGAKVWNGKEMIKPGDSITDVIRKAIEDSDRFVVVLSDSPSVWQSKELALAKASHLKIIPVLVHGAQIPDSLSDIRAINLQEKSDDGFKELLRVAS